jgi:ABC-type antimicrobial peptide transport system permease subunit
VKIVINTLKTAVRALRRNVGRSLLTCLGIVIGIASVISIAEIGQGSSQRIQQTIARLGANVVQIDPADSMHGGVSTGSGGRANLTPEDCDAIRRECPAVRWAAPAVDSRTQIIYGNKNWSPYKVLGTTPDYFSIRDWPVETGALFTDLDVIRCAPVGLIGKSTAKGLFGREDPVGKEVRVKNVRIKIIGLLTSKGASPFGSDYDDQLICPWTTVKFRLSGVRNTTASANAANNAVAAANQVNSLSDLYPSQQPQLYVTQSAAQAADWPQMRRFADINDIYVSANTRQEVPDVLKQVTVLLRERHHLADGEPDDFRIRDLTEISQTVASTESLITNLLLIVAMISLVVGGVGIMNIMLVSVTERTREIGLRMAVGARSRDILWQFLTEAVILCLVGGAMGIGLGRLASIVVNTTLRWPTLTSPLAMAAALTVSATVGILFGFYPAWKASRLDPIDALRYE